MTLLMPTLPDFNCSFSPLSQRPRCVGSSVHLITGSRGQAAGRWDRGGMCSILNASNLLSSVSLKK
ncbi:hypothetical protein, partial [Legionella wadsworthii]